MRRFTLWALLIVGIGAAVGLLLLLRAKPPAATARASGNPPATSGGDTGARPTERTRPELPRVTAPADTERAHAGQEERVFVREDGALVRDHRGDAPEPGLRGTVPRPGVEAKVDPPLILGVRNAMRPIVHRCAENLPAAGPGEQRRVQSQVVISIRGGRLMVDEAIVEPGGVSAADATMLRECIESQVEALVLPADGHEEVSGYTLRLPYRLPR